MSNFISVAVPLFYFAPQSQMLTALNMAGERLIGMKTAPIDQLFTQQQCQQWLDLAIRVQHTELTLTIKQDLAWLHQELSKASFAIEKQSKLKQEFQYESMYEVSFSDLQADDQVLITIVDHSHHVLHHEATKRSFHFLKGLLDLTSTLFFVIDQESRLIFSNLAFIKHNFSEQQTESNKSNNRLRLTHDQLPFLQQESIDLIHRGFASKVSQQVQVEWPNHVGEHHFFQLLIQPLIHQDQEVEQLLVLGSDITELVFAHNEQKKLHLALTEAQRLEAVGQMAGTIAHDFNGFLTILFSSLSLFELDELNEEQKELIDGMYRVCDQARQLTQKLLSFSRLQKHEQQEQQEFGELKMIDEHFKFAIPRLARSSHVKITYHSTIDKAGFVPLNAAQCSQLVVNLVNNAIEAIPTEIAGLVSVYCALEHDQNHDLLVIQVSDNGVGISKAQQELIFEPFFTTKKEHGGTGLGLASARSIVTQAGGDLTLSSVLKEGSTFTIKLPIHETNMSQA